MKNLKNIIFYRLFIVSKKKEKITWCTDRKCNIFPFLNVEDSIICNNVHKFNKCLIFFIAKIAPIVLSTEILWKFTWMNWGYTSTRLLELLPLGKYVILPVRQVGCAELRRGLRNLFYEKTSSSFTHLSLSFFLFIMWFLTSYRLLRKCDFNLAAN